MHLRKFCLKQIRYSAIVVIKSEHNPFLQPIAGLLHELGGLSTSDPFSKWQLRCNEIPQRLKNSFGNNI